MKTPLPLFHNPKDMAKKIVNESQTVMAAATPAAAPAAAAAAAPASANEPGVDPEPQSEPEGTDTGADSGQTSGETTPTQPEQKEQEGQPQSPDATPDYADRLLKVFPAYAQLYIDRLGSTYTADTPPAFRTDATLYTNPYHKD